MGEEAERSNLSQIGKRHVWCFSGQMFSNVKLIIPHDTAYALAYERLVSNRHTYFKHVVTFNKYVLSQNWFKTRVNIYDAAA